MFLDSPFCLINNYEQRKVFPSDFLLMRGRDLVESLRAGVPANLGSSPHLSGIKVIRSGENTVIYIIEWDNYLCKINYAGIIFSAYVHVNNSVYECAFVCVCVCLKIGYYYVLVI